MISVWADSRQHKYQDNITKLNPAVFIWYHKPSSTLCYADDDFTAYNPLRILGSLISVFYQLYFRPRNLPTLVSSRGVFVAISKRAENLTQLISTQMRLSHSFFLLAGRKSDLCDIRHKLFINMEDEQNLIADNPASQFISAKLNIMLLYPVNLV